MHGIGAEAGEVHGVGAEAGEVHRIGGERTDPEHGVGHDRPRRDLAIGPSEQVGQVNPRVEIHAQEPGARGLRRVGLVGAQLDAGELADPLDDLRR